MRRIRLFIVQSAIAALAGGCDTDPELDAILDGGRADVEADAGHTTRPSAEPGYTWDRFADGGLRIVITWSGEVCTTSAGTGSVVITSKIGSDGKVVCILLDNDLLVDDSACVHLDAGAEWLEERRRACLQDAWVVR